MYVDVSLDLSEAQVKRLASGQRIRVTKANVASASHRHRISVTATQKKAIDRIAAGSQGWMLLKLSAPALKRTVQNGGGFFDSVGSFFKDTFTKPSGLLGIASMLPGPLSLPLKAASVVTKLTGHGCKSKGKGFNVAQFARKPARKTPCLFNIPEMNEVGCHPVDEALLGMGFKHHHILQMKGSGIFSSLWKSGRRLGSFLLPYAKKKGLALLKEYGPGLAKRGAEMAIGRLSGSRGGGARPPTTSHYVKFSLPQERCIVQNMQGSGIFSDVKDKISEFLRSVGTAAGNAARSEGAKAFKFLRKGGNLATLGSVH
jgi:hypothetical protein